MAKVPLRNILLVDDSKEDVELLLEAFEDDGAVERVRTVADGRQAMDYLSGAGDFSDRERYPFPDIVLLDINMPRRNGFEVVEWMRSRSDRVKTTVVVMLTTSQEPRDVKRAYHLGANSFLVKPSTFDALCGLVRDVRSYWLNRNCFARA